MDTATLLSRIEGFINQLGMAPSRFGRDAANDPRLVFDLRRGRRLMTHNRQRICSFLERLPVQPKRQGHE